MNNDLLKKYIDEQPAKIVTKLDFVAGKLSYDKIVQCQKRTDAKPEELCRAYLLTKLVNELGYDPAKIEIEHEYTAGRPHTITSRIDVIVRDANGDAFLFIEVKNEEEYATVDKDNVIEEQLFKLAGMERTDGRRVKYLVLYTTNDTTGTLADECIIIDNQKYPTYADWEAVRDFTNTIPARYGKAQKKPYKKGSEKDLETNFSHGMLLQLQKDLHNVLWGGGGTDDNDVFSSLTNLILSKIQDEDEKEDGDTYDFQSMTFAKDGDEEFETNEQLFDRINELYRRALKSKLYILDEKELGKSYVVDTKKFSLSKLKYAVQKLEGLSFVDGKNSLSGKDILGDFFEGIIRDVSLHYISLLSESMLDIKHMHTLRFKMCVAFIVYKLCDKNRLAGVCLEEFLKKNQEYNFNEKLFRALAVHDVDESSFLGHTITQLVVDELEAFYNVLSGESGINRAEKSAK